MSSATPGDRPIYRLLTGKDDRAFCERVSEALEQGWRLYGSPTIAWDHEAGSMKAAQAARRGPTPRAPSAANGEVGLAPASSRTVASRTVAQAIRAATPTTT